MCLLLGLEMFAWFRVCLSCLSWESLSFVGKVLGAKSNFGFLEVGAKCSIG